MAIGARIAAIMQKQGQTLTLRRPGTPNIDVALRGSIIGASSEPQLQGVVTSSFRVRLSNAEIAAQVAYVLPIRPMVDQILDGHGRAYVIKSVDTKRPRGDTVEHVLIVEG